MRRLGHFLIILSVVIVLATTWWWALVGMRDEIGSAIALTAIVTLCTGLLLEVLNP